jgi:arginine-tRNA-protein transferase
MAKNPDQNNQQPESNESFCTEKKDSLKKDSIQRLSFYATPEHECNYLPEQKATTLFADPDAQLNNQMYSQLSVYGFRRSGKYIYRPSCANCKACIPVRVPVTTFTPRKSQQRILNKNRDLESIVMKASYHDEHFSLYRKYISARHPDGGMDEAEPDKYLEFLTSDWSDTLFVEFRLQGKLLSVAIIDKLETGLSAVYTFFDPDYSSRSLGTYAVLWSINKTSEWSLPYLYLGFWINDCQKMSYKKDFQPIELFQNGTWILDN